MAGKESKNFFTPLQKLSEVAPSTQGTNLSENKAGNSNEEENTPYNKNIQTHPAFGFKAALIRLVGNMVFENKDNQDLVSKFYFIDSNNPCSGALNYNHHSIKTFKVFMIEFQKLF